MCAVAVHLKKGDLFDGPSDLVVLPCSTAGTYTKLVADKLRRFDIPRPRPAELGHVEIHALTGNAAQVAQYAALATSVAVHNSTPEAILAIGSALGRATREYAGVSAVNAPLLGAGAGHLRSEVVVAQLRDGFRSSSADDAVLTVFVRHEDVYQRL